MSKREDGFEYRVYGIDRAPDLYSDLCYQGNSRAKALKALKQAQESDPPYEAVRFQRRPITYGPWRAAPSTGGRGER